MITFQANSAQGDSAGPRQHARRRVLVSAYAVSPVRGSEPAAGWNICMRLAAYHDVTVLCSPEVPPRAQLFREEITEHLRRRGPVPGLTFHFVDSPPVAYWLQRESPLMRRTVYLAGYRSWQRAAYRAAARLHHGRPFDIVHHLNISGYREPGYLWRLPVPFLWGPISGAANVPVSFLSMMGWSERLFFCSRNVVNELQKRTAWRCRQAARRAQQVWAVGEADCDLVARLWHGRVEAMNDAGASPQPDARAKTRDPSRPLQVVWSGQHIGRKALPILLHALARLRRDECPAIDLTILGDGAEGMSWRTLAHDLGLDSCTRWTGWLTRSEALAEVARADVLAVTSVLEGTSHVVMEALSLGLPVICHDACGMGTTINNSCGVKVPLRDPQTSIDGFAAGLRSLAMDHQKFSARSAGALERAREVSWDAHVRRIAMTYDRVLSRCAAQPVPLAPDASGSDVAAGQVAGKMI